MEIVSWDNLIAGVEYFIIIVIIKLYANPRAKHKEPSLPFTVWFSEYGVKCKRELKLNFCEGELKISRISR